MYVHRWTSEGPQQQDIRLHAGKPEPLGPSRISETAKHGVNFALHSQHAEAITLVLSDANDRNPVEVPLERTGDTWHIAVEGCPLSGVLYGFRVEGSTGWDAGDRCVACLLLTLEASLRGWSRMHPARRPQPATCAASVLLSMLGEGDGCRALPACVSSPVHGRRFGLCFCPLTLHSFSITVAMQVGRHPATAGPIRAAGEGPRALRAAR